MYTERNVVGKKQMMAKTLVESGGEKGVWNKDLVAHIGFCSWQKRCFNPSICSWFLILSVSIFFSSLKVRKKHVVVFHFY